MASPTRAQTCIFVDGSSRGNPGPAGIGVVVFDAGSEEVSAEISTYIGITTNNVAEYEAVIHALKWMKDSSVRCAVIKLDSELVYRQLTGKYRVKSPHIALLMKRLSVLRSEVGEVKFMLIPREENKLADRLAQKASKRVKPKRAHFRQLPLR
ncbi:ribonuclease HI family protein [candidate division WOR-3 bacterium]|nr:ribonuclease HI family protein [candidate division WOR-3 bacterium]